jgi:hypothetical protein
MTREVAIRVHELLRSAIGAINGSVAVAQEGSSVDELQAVRLGAAQALDAIFEGLLKPIYREHPDLIPQELDRRYLKL